MPMLRDADTGEAIREATDGEADASDAAFSFSRRECGGADKRGVFELDGRRVYVPLDPMPRDFPIGGPGGD